MKLTMMSLNHSCGSRISEFMFLNFFILTLTLYRLHYIRYQLDPDFLERPLNSNQKSAYLASSLDVDAINQKHYKKFAHKKCRQPMRTDSLVLYYSKNFFLIEAVNAKLGIFISSGIVDHLIKKSSIRQVFDYKTKSGPKKLSFTHLFGVFGVFLIGCSSSTFIFLIEHAVKRFERI